MSEPEADPEAHDPGIDLAEIADRSEARPLITDSMRMLTGAALTAFDWMTLALGDELATDEERDAAIDKYLATVADVSQKAEQCAYIRDRFMAVEGELKSEIERLATILRYRQRERERFEGRVFADFQRLPEKKVKTMKRGTIGIKRNPPRVELNEELLPSPTQSRHLWSFKPPTPNKTAIKAEIQAGIDVPGAKLVQDESMQWGR